MRFDSLSDPQGAGIRTGVSLALSALFMLLSVPAGAEFNFSVPYRTYETGDYARSVIDGDWNGDGHVDVAVANADDNTVSVFLGLGDGTLTDQVTYAVGAYPNCVRAGDLDQNGTQDLAVACYEDSEVTILWGAGDGTFPSRTDLTGTASPLSLAIGDLEGSDPFPELAVGTASTTVWVFPNNGGVFGAPVTLGAGLHHDSIVIADLNLDGKNDLVVPGYTHNNISLFLGMGNTTFDAPVTMAIPGPQTVITALVNGDAYPDVISNSHGTFLTFLGNGDGTLSPPSAVDYITAYGLAAGDFDGDGNLDVVTNDIDVVIFKGNGDGTFGARTRFPGPDAKDLVTADLDGDNRLDLVTVTNSFSRKGLATHRGWGDGSFGLNRTYQMGPSPFQATAGDVNNDGFPDLVVADMGIDRGFTVRLGEFGGFGPKTSYLGFGTHTTAKLGDINGDGDLDVIVGGEGSYIAVYLGNGDGTFDEAVGYLSWQNPISIAVGDLNQDGYDDVVSGNSNLASVWMGAADGTLTWTEDYTAGPPVVLRDFNGDGLLDLVGSAHSVTRFFPGNGNGTFGSVLVSSNSTSFPWQLGCGDLNGDTSLDLVLGSRFGDMITFLGDGQGNFQEIEILATGKSIQQIDIGDLDLDGNLDIAVADSKNGVDLFHGNGDGTLAQEHSIGIGQYPYGLVISDFDQDAALDIAAIGNTGQGPYYAVILYNLALRQVGVESPVAVFHPLRLVANPSRNRMAVEFELKEPGLVRLEVFDLTGRRVASLVNGLLPAGIHTRTWRGESASPGAAPPGVYVVRVVTEGQSRTTKAVWLGR